MANPFDQFGKQNPFDQFSAPKPAGPNPFDHFSTSPLPIDKTSQELRATPSSDYLTQEATDFVHNFWGAQKAASEEGLAQIKEGIGNMLGQRNKPTTVLRRGLGALETVGGAFQYVFSPVQSFAEATLGKSFERATGDKGSAKHIGEYVSFATQLAADPAIAQRALTKLTDVPAMARVGDDIMKSWNPTGRGDEAKAVEHMIRGAYTGPLNHAKVQAAMAMSKFQKLMATMPHEDAVNFIDRFERGIKQPSAELQDAADAMAQRFDYWKDQIQGLGKGYLDNTIEYYFPHLFKDPDKARAFIEAKMGEAGAVAREGAKRPLKGSGSFLRQRTYRYLTEALDAGLELKHSNPLTNVLVRETQMAKFYFGNKLLDELKSAGLAKGVHYGKRVPFGWQAVDDPAFRFRMYDEGTQTLAELGKYYMPENAALVVNNFLSKRLAGSNSVYDAFRSLANAVNAVNFSFSGFHATAETMDTIGSEVAAGLDKVLKYKDLSGVKDVFLAPRAVVRNWKLGKDFEDAYKGLKEFSPNEAKLVEAAKAGGFNIRMPEQYNVTAAGSFAHSLTHGTFFNEVADTMRDSPLTGPVKLLFRGIATTGAPVMEYLVPRLKNGLFARMANDWLEHNPNATIDELRGAMAKISDTIDDRMGEMNYDNIFWKNVHKDLAFISLRAFGWDLGSARGLGGGIYDIGKAAVRGLKGLPVDVTHRATYVAGIAAANALAGGMMQYLMTGKGPSQPLDYFYPRTGKVDQYGTEQRLSLPSNMRDLFEFNYAGPVATVENKANPVITSVLEMLQNRDFYGATITNPNDDPFQEAHDLASFWAEKFVPFVYSRREQRRSEASRTGEKYTSGEQILNWMGVSQAPFYVTHPGYEPDLNQATRKQLREKARREQ